MPITIVGDMLQSVFSFQGATPELFTNIHKIVPSVKNVTLKINYRSTAQLVDMASQYRFIAKDIIPDVEGMEAYNPPAKDSITIHEFENCFQESNFVAQSILQLHRDKHINFSDIAILSRTNKNLIDMEAVCIKYRIPYKIKYDSRSLLRQSPFKFIYSILSLSINPRDVNALMQILELFKGFGKVTLDNIYQLIQSYLIANPQTPSLLSCVDHLGLKKDKKYTCFKNIVSKILNPVIKALNNPSTRPDALFKTITYSIVEHFVFNDSPTFIKDPSGYIDMDYEDFSKVTNLLQNIYLSSMEDEVFATKHPSQQIQEIYESLQLSKDSDDIDNSKDRVVLSTIHSFKGLEADYVFFMNIHSLMQMDIQNQEQRCLWYVAVTRARKKLFITGSDRALSYDNTLRTTKRNPFFEYYLKGIPLIRAKYS